MGSFDSAEDSEQLHTPPISGSLSPKPSAPRIRWPTNGNQSNGTTRQPREAHPRPHRSDHALASVVGPISGAYPQHREAPPRGSYAENSFARARKHEQWQHPSVPRSIPRHTHTHTHTCCNSLANTRTSYQWHSEACATPKPNTCVSSVCKRGLCLSGPRHHQFSYCQTQKLKHYCAHEINFQTSCARAHQTIYHVRSYAIRRSPRRWQFTGQGHTHARAHTHTA